MQEQAKDKNIIFHAILKFKDELDNKSVNQIATEALEVLSRLESSVEDVHLLSSFPETLSKDISELHSLLLTLKENTDSATAQNDQKLEDIRFSQKKS